MKRLFLAALIVSVTCAATSALAQQLAPRDIWPQAASAARDGDFAGAEKRTTELLGTGRTYGVRTYPLYAASAAGLASESWGENGELGRWASKVAEELDPRSPSVAFSEADRAARKRDWAGALTFALQGFSRAATNYRTRSLAGADMLIAAAVAMMIAAVLLAIALFVRYFRSMAHDFRELLSLRLTGGSVSVVAFALLFLPLFLWLGPVWLIFYWLAIFFSYATLPERIAITVVLVFVALLPILVDDAADRIATIDGPVLSAALSSSAQAYDPQALRRLQEVAESVPSNPTVQLLLGNLHSYEGNDDQAAVHYRRAVELQPGYAGAHVNLGNLHYLNNEFQAAITEYEKAERADGDLAVAFFNHSIAAGETYKFDQQAAMLAKARDADRNFVERIGKSAPQKVVMYHPSIAESWDVAKEIAAVPNARALFGNYATFDRAKSAMNPLTIGAILALIAGPAVWAMRRRRGFANACIKCGRTFCSRCKVARESATYCTQCIHIYLKRDGVSLDTKRRKLDEVTDHQAGMLRRNRILAGLLPGSAQMVEGHTVVGLAGAFFFALFAAVAIFAGRLAPALGPAAEVAQWLVRIGAIVLAIVVWLILALPVFKRKAAA